MNVLKRRKRSVRRGGSTAADFVRRRRGIVAWKYGKIFIVVLVLVGLSYFDRHGYFLAQQSEFDYYEGRVVEVVNVVDGDTVDIDVPDRTTGEGRTRVRLWGIDCPETAKQIGFHGSKEAIAAEAFADEATLFTRNLVLGKMVTLRLETSRVRGYYGRLLAHVVVTVDTVSGEETTLSAELLKAGLARADGRWEHSLIRDYHVIEEGAKRAGVGLWGDGE